MVPLLAISLAAALAAIWLAASVRLLRPDERALLIRMRRVVPGLRGPGVLLTIPGLDRLLRFHLDNLDRAQESLSGAGIAPAEAAEIMTALRRIRGPGGHT